jgi:hypothetical protein
MSSVKKQHSQLVNEETYVKTSRFITQDWLQKVDRIPETIFLLSLITFITSFGPPILTMYVPRDERLLISYGEIADLLTPFLVTGVVIFLLWQIYSLQTASELDIPNLVPLGLFVLSAILMINGHGIHLSANALSHYLKEQDIGISFRLNYMYDEIVSHYMWHIGGFNLSVSAALFQLKYPAYVRRQSLVLLLFSAMIYAFTFTFATIEGGTMFIITPLTVFCLLGFLIVIGKYKLSVIMRPVVFFFLLSNLMMLFGWIIYGIVFGGFPSPIEMLR